MPPTSDRLWWLVAGGTSVVAAVAAARVAGAPVIEGAFGDGRSYRRMARGERGSPPFCRRVLGPALARRLGPPGGDGGGAAAFRRVSVPSLAAAAVGTGALTWRIARARGTAPGRATAAALTAAALVPAMPHGARLAVQVPEFPDPLAAALGAGWLLLATADDPRARAVAPLAAGAAALAREQWGVVVPLALAAARPGRAALAGHAVAVATAAVVVVAQPAGPGSEVWGPMRALRRLASLPGIGEAAWAATFVPGALLLLVGPAVRAAAAGGASPALRACLATAAAQAVLGHLGGTDLPRLDAGALVPLLPALLGTAAGGSAAPVALTLAATVPAWRPGTPLEPTEPGYEAFYLPYMHPPMRSRLLGDAGRRAGGLAAGSAAVALGRRVLGRRVLSRRVLARRVLARRVLG